MSAWYLKLILLSVGAAFVILIALANWEKNKKYLVYLLIALFAQTGFAYQIEPGYFTSAAELLYFGLLIIMATSWLKNKSSVPDIGLKRSVSFYLLVSFIGIFTAVLNNVRLLNIFIEVKSYLGYVFFIFLVPFLVNEKKDVLNYLRAFAILSIIPFIYVVPNLQSLSYLEEMGRYQFSFSWGALNVFIGYVLPLIFVLLALQRIAASRARKAILIVYIGLCVYVLFYSQTRSGWAAFLISLVVFSYLTKTKAKIVLIGIISLAVLFFVGKTAVIQSVMEKRLVEQTIEQQDSSLKKRFERWETAIATFKKHPIFGSGWGGNFYLSFDGALSKNSISALPRWHNSFFEILSQLGVLGILTYYFVWFRIGRYALRSWKLVLDSHDRDILAGLISAVMSIFIYSLGEQQFYRIETASVSWFIVGLLIAYARFVTLQAAETSVFPSQAKAHI